MLCDEVWLKRWQRSRFFKRTHHGGCGNGVHDFQSHQLLSEQTQRPARVARRRLATGDLQQTGLAFAVQDRRTRWARLSLALWSVQFERLKRKFELCDLRKEISCYATS